MENIINQIQKDILNPETSVSTILRKAKVLASNLKNEEFKAWVDNELNGYFKDNNDIPNYRKSRALTFGNFIDPYGSEMRNMRIPILHLSEEFRKLFKDLTNDPIDLLILGQGVSSLETLAQNNSPILQEWPPDLVSLLPPELGRGYSCVSVGKVIDRSGIIQVLDTIRTRLLNFILELQEEYPEIKNSDFDDIDIPKEQVNMVFNNNIYGDGNIVASGSDFQQRANQQIKKNDIESLIKYMKSLGLTEEDAIELKDAIDEDCQRDEPKKFGPKVIDWIGKMTKNALRGTWNIGVSVATALLTKAISKYYGWE